MQRTCTRKGCLLGFGRSIGAQIQRIATPQQPVGRDEQHRLDHEGTRSETHCLITRLSEQRSVLLVSSTFSQEKKRERIIKRSALLLSMCPMNAIPRCSLGGAVFYHTSPLSGYLSFFHLPSCAVADEFLL